MIRQDYVLRMIQEFMEALRRIRSLKQGRRWDEANGELDAEFQKLVGEGAAGIVKLSETELLARIVKEGPTQSVRDKTFILVSILAEAGDVAAATGHEQEAREYRLKGLHLLLDLLAREDIYEWPEFVPKVDQLRDSLGDSSLPLRTMVMLMHHYERSGQLGKAEDSLFSILDAELANGAVIGFGTEFYQRLLKHTDAQLEAGGLPRAEVEEGLRELKGRGTGGS
jgi:hypothetical protein